MRCCAVQGVLQDCTVHGVDMVEGRSSYRGGSPIEESYSAWDTVYMIERRRGGREFQMMMVLPNHLIIT